MAIRVPTLDAEQIGKWMRESAGRSEPKELQIPLPVPVIEPRRRRPLRRLLKRVRAKFRRNATPISR